MALRIQCVKCGKLLILGPRAGTTLICPACGTVQNAPAYDVVEDLRPPAATQQPFSAGWPGGVSGGIAGGVSPMQSQANPWSNAPPGARQPIRPAPSPTPMPMRPAGPWNLGPRGGNAASGYAGAGNPGVGYPGAARQASGGAPPFRWGVALALALIIGLGGGGALLLVHGWLAARPAAAVAGPTWEQQHRDQILQLKADAERLAIGHHLAEAHHAYQELSELVSGQNITDADLRDQLARARADQELIYQKLLNGDAPTIASGVGGVGPDNEQGASGARGETYPSQYNAFRPGAATEPALSRGSALPGGSALPPIPASATPSVNALPGIPGAGGVNSSATAGGMPPIPNPAGGSPPAAPPGPISPSTPPTPSDASPNGATPAVAPGTPATPPPAAAPPARAVPEYRPGEVPSQDDVEAAIGRGVDFLLAHLKNGEVDDGLSPQTPDHAAQDALVVDALLTAGQANGDARLDPNAPLMRDAIEHLKRLALRTDPSIIQAPITYGRSLRAQALAIYHRPEDMPQLQDDVSWLVHAEVGGAFTYDDRLTLIRPNPNDPTATVLPAYAAPPPMFERALPGGSPTDDPRDDSRTQNQTPLWDNFNSAYGVIGVAAGQRAGIAVPAQFWGDVEQHWTNCQLDDGSWATTADQQTGTLSNTCGGVASLLSVREFLEPLESGVRLNQAVFPGPLAAGLAWLEQGDRSMDVYNARTIYLGYNLFDVERVGLLSGFKHLGRHDWFGELTGQVVATQWPRGSWGRKDDGIGAIVDTSYVVMFLARGQAPVMMSKLRFPPVWDNRPRDVANLSAYASAQLGQPINWEAVGYDHDWRDWTDAPILFIASHRVPLLKDEDVSKIRQYVEAGGLLVTHADEGDPGFNKWAQDLARQLFPDLPLTDLPPNSPIFTVGVKLKKPPRLMGVSNGARVLMVHVPADVALSWERQDFANKADDFALGLNLYEYTCGGVSGSNGGMGHLRPRLASPWRAGPTTRPDALPLPVARLRYPGQWDPEPGAWRRMRETVDGSTNFDLQVTPIDMAALQPRTAPLAVLTGVGACTFSPAQIAALRDYVTAGGTVLIDACGGSRASGGPAAFADSVERVLLPGVDPHHAAQPMTTSNPLLLASVRGMANLSNPRLRPFAAAQSNTAGFLLMELRLGQGRIIYSPLDLTSGLLDTDAWGIAGYDPAYATAVARNVVLWSAARRGI